jgi:hypothetical protein
MSSRNLFFSTSILFSFVLALSACTGNSNNAFEKQRSLELIDSLEAQLLQVQSKLKKIDLKDLQERKDYVDAELVFLKVHADPDDLSPEILRILDEYRGFSKMYKNIGKYGPRIIAENEELSIQLRTLRKSVEKGDYAKEQFKVYLAKEREDVMKLSEYASVYIDPIVETEPLFFKRMDEIEALSTRIRERKGLPE